MTKVGVNDPSHFSKDYKTLFKIAPRCDRFPGGENRPKTVISELAK
jgi:hypothetical protein